MKNIDLFCASPASTAICSSIDQRSMIRHGTRPISRHIHHIGDRRKTLPPLPCTSQLPIDPKSYYQRNRKSSANKPSDFRRKSSADKNDLISPHDSSRYLLSDTPFFDFLSDSDHVKALVPSQKMRPGHQLSPDGSPSLSKSSARGRDLDHVKALVPSNDSPSLKPLSRGRELDHVKALVPGQKVRTGHLISADSPSLKSSSARSHHRDQVVELRVSIHCKGCEGKVRKHISRMEGVTSFSIDLATKKVTIIGDVTPLGVLTSVSRVKNAQFWPYPTSSSSSSSSSPMVGLGY